MRRLTRRGWPRPGMGRERPSETLRPARTLVLRQPWPGLVLLRVDPRYFRPAETHSLLGDAGEARRVLGWEPKVTLEELTAEMVRTDLLERRQASTPKEQPGPGLRASLPDERSESLAPAPSSAYSSSMPTKTCSFVSRRSPTLLTSSMMTGAGDYRSSRPLGSSLNLVPQWPTDLRVAACV